MKIVYKAPGSVPRTMEILNDLYLMQYLVDGYIETVRFDKDLVLVCNDMGRLLELQPNTFGICGSFFICGDAGEEFRGLTEAEAKNVIEQIERRGKRDEEVTKRVG